MRTILSLLLFVLGCAAPYGTGHFDSIGWTHDTHRLRVRTEADGSFVSSSWRISSHTPSGRVRRDNLHVRRLDRDDDGRMDRRYWALGNALELEHRTDGASLFVDTFIVPMELQDAPLERLAQAFVSSLSGTDQVMLRRGGWNVGWATSRYEAVSLDEVPAAVHGHAAHVTVLEVQRTDSGGAVGAARAAVTLVRAPYTWREEKFDGAYREWPVLLVVGYVASADVFGRHWDDYGHLLDLLEIGAPARETARVPEAPANQRGAAQDDSQPFATSGDDSAEGSGSGAEAGSAGDEVVP